MLVHLSLRNCQIETFNISFESIKNILKILGFSGLVSHPLKLLPTLACVT